MRVWIPAAAGLLMFAGCAQQPKMLWLRADGQRIVENPVLMQQADMDRTICLGERSKAALSGVTVATGGLAGLAAQMERAQAANTVQTGCMAERGYVLVPEDQADTKRAELAAIAEAKRRQEVAQAPPAPQRRR